MKDLQIQPTEECLPIIIRDNIEIIDSRIIASRLNVNHSDWLQNVILKYQPEIEEEFGKIEFSVLKTENLKGGRPERIAYLTEGQAYYIASLSKNTQPVKKIKALLVKSFLLAREWYKERKDSKLEHKDFTLAIQQNNDPCKPYHFSNESFMIYDIIFGTSSRKMKDVKNFKDLMTNEQLTRFNKLLRLDTSMNELGYDYTTRKKKLIERNNYLLNQKQLKA